MSCFGLVWSLLMCRHGFVALFCSLFFVFLLFVHFHRISKQSISRMISIINFRIKKIHRNYIIEVDSWFLSLMLASHCREGMHGRRVAAVLVSLGQREELRQVPRDRGLIRSVGKTRETSSALNGIRLARYHWLCRCVLDGISNNNFSMFITNNASIKPWFLS